MNKNIKLFLLVIMYVILCKIVKWYINKMKIIILGIISHYLRTLTQDIGIVHNKLILLNGCMYH